MAGIYGKNSLVLAQRKFYWALGTYLFVPEAELSFRAHDVASGNLALGRGLSVPEIEHLVSNIRGNATRELTAKAGGAKIMNLPPEQLFEKYVFPVSSPSIESELIRKIDGVCPSSDSGKSPQSSFACLPPSCLGSKVFVSFFLFFVSDADKRACPNAKWPNPSCMHFLRASDMQAD